MFEFLFMARRRAGKEENRGEATPAQQATHEHTGK
jgi:hypothetical protein